MLQLYFNAKWILISEVTFYSEPRSERPFVVTKMDDQSHKQPPSKEVNQPVEVAPIDINVKSFDADGQAAEKGDQRQTSDSIGIVIGSLLTVILLLLMGILFMIHRSRVSKEKRATPTHSLLTSSTKSTNERFNVPLNTSDQVIQYTPYR